MILWNNLFCKLTDTPYYGQLYCSPSGFDDLPPSDFDPDIDIYVGF